MLTSVRLKNFKAFSDNEFQLRPLTILTGLNSSGKSSVIQAIMLANIKSADAPINLGLNAKPGLILGQPADVLHSDADDSQIEIKLSVGATTHRLVLETNFEGAESATFVRRVSGSGFSSPITFLGAERWGPRTSQPVSPVVNDENVSLVDVGHDGSFVAHALSTHGRREVQRELLHPSQQRVTTLQSQVEAWMGDLVGAVQLDAQLIPRTSMTTLRIRSGGGLDWQLPTNVGFGITYSLPIVVAALASVPKSILIVESPEAHLHPAAQSALGKFLALVSGAGVQVIIETHSDHVLNGVRRSVAQEIVDPASIAIHFLNGGEAPVQVSVNRRGQLSDWPLGFFDQMENDLRQITGARL